MNLDPLTAIGALDGRYRSRVEPLAPILSEFGLLEARVEVECRWFQTLAQTAEMRLLGASELEFVHGQAMTGARVEGEDETGPNRSIPAMGRARRPGGPQFKEGCRKVGL